VEYDRDDLLEFLRAGLALGAFAGCDDETQAVIRLCARGSMAALQTRKASGYEVSTYLLSFAERTHLRGLVMKIIPVTATRLTEVTNQEFTLLGQLVSEAYSYTVPRALGTFESRGNHIFVTELLAGNMATEKMLSAEDVAGIARAIGHLQQSLAITEFGRTNIAGVSLPSADPYYGPKTRKFIETHRKLTVSRGEVTFVEVLESLRNASPVIVSDRSPANILLSDGQIGMFDFGLVLVGVPFEDWSWFIDDPRLVSELSREEMVRVFWESLERPAMSLADTTTSFHVSAIFVCIKQCCLMEDAGRHAMASHYLQRMRISAESIGSEDAIALVQKLEPVS
jgi:aminoglycoside phosphotransferase (APT) family kinase protein